MPSDEQTSQQRGGYGVGPDPVVSGHDDRIEVSEGFGAKHEEAFLLGLARDPNAIFACWSADWESVFVEGAPADKQAHLRAVCQSNAEEISLAVEPMKGTGTLTVPTSGATYDLELGFYHPPGNWVSVAVAKPITMPAKGTAPSLDFEIATIPVHLSFQRMIDLFRATNGDEITESVARLQSRAASDGIESLSEPDREILRVLEFSADDAERAGNVREGFVTSGRHFARRLDSLLGLGATSPGSSAGGSGS